MKNQRTINKKTMKNNTSTNTQETINKKVNEQSTTNQLKINEKAFKASTINKNQTNNSKPMKCI